MVWNGSAPPLGVDSTTSAGSGQELYCNIDAGYAPLHHVFGNIAYSVGAVIVDRDAVQKVTLSTLIDERVLKYQNKDPERKSLHEYEHGI